MRDLDSRGEFYHDGHNNNPHRWQEGLSILVIKIKMIASYISSTCDCDICIFVNIIISTYLNYMTGGDF